RCRSRRRRLRRWLSGTGARRRGGRAGRRRRRAGGSWGLRYAAEHRNRRAGRRARPRAGFAAAGVAALDAPDVRVTRFGLAWTPEVVILTGAMPKVLLVDDDPAVRSALGRFVGRLGHEVVQ